MRKRFFKFLVCLVQEKMNMKFLLASMKTLTNSKSCSESRIKFLFRLSFALIGRFFSCTFRNNFQDHRWVTEQPLETHAAIRIPEQDLCRGLLEEISQLVSDFIEERINFTLDFLPKKRT
jgi:hypothetical protein